MKPTRIHMADRTILGRGRDGIAMLAIASALSCAQAEPGRPPEGKPGPSASALATPPPAKPDQAEPGGPARITLQSTVLGEERKILVRTPEGYERGSARFPVLYLTDGDRHIGHTVSTVEFLAANGRMPEVIVVGISNTDRTRDLTPTKASMKNEAGKEMKLPTAGGADKFLEFIEKELVPHVEKSYRTQPYRVFAGHSFGGLFAVHALVSKPELFQAVISVAPSLHWDDAVVVKRAEQLLSSRPELDRTVFVTLGDEPGEPMAAFKRLQEIAAKKSPKGFQMEAVHMPDEDHGSIVMRSHYFGLRKVFDGWRMPKDPSTPGVAKSLDAVDAHYKTLSKRFGFDIAPPEPLVNQLGYDFLFDDKTDEAIAVFKSNVERYPGSANVYDSLAEAYEKKGQLDLAATNYGKAVKVAEETGQPNLEIFKTNFARVSGKAKPAPTCQPL